MMVVIREVWRTSVYQIPEACTLGFQAGLLGFETPLRVRNLADVYGTFSPSDSVVRDDSVDPYKSLPPQSTLVV